MFLLCSSEGPVIYSMGEDDIVLTTVSNSMSSMGGSNASKSLSQNGPGNKLPLDLGETNILQKTDVSNMLMGGDETFERMANDSLCGGDSFNLTGHPVV